MPRKSAKDERVDELEVILRERKEASDTRFLMDMPCEVEDDMDVVYHEEYEKVTSSRYLDRKKYLRREPRWKKMLYEEGFLTESEFLAHFRVNRSVLWKILELVKDDNILHIEKSYETYLWPPRTSFNDSFEVFGKQW
jgi:hypothetical protein